MIVFVEKKEREAFAFNKNIGSFYVITFEILTKR